MCSVAPTKFNHLHAVELTNFFFLISHGFNFKCFRQVCDYSLLIAYYGVLCIYIIVIADSVHTVTESNLGLNWEIRIYICFATLGGMCLAQVRSVYNRDWNNNKSII